MSGAERRGTSPPVSPPRLDEVVSALKVVAYKARVEDGRIVIAWIQGAIEEYLGYEPSEIVGVPDFLAGRIDPDDLERAPAALESLFASGHATYEYRVRDRDGGERWVRDEASLVEDETGRYMVGGWTDITDHVAAMAALEHRAHADRVIGRVAKRFLDVHREDLSGTVEQSLEESCALFGFDSGLALLFRDSSLVVEMVFEWHRKGATIGIDTSEDPLLAELTTARALKDDVASVLAVPRVKEYFTAAAPELKVLEPDVKSLYVAPLADAGTAVGFVVFTSQQAERDLTDEDIAIVQVLAEIFSGALLRRRMEAMLQVSERHLGDVTISAHVGTWSVGLGEPSVEWSDETYEILGVGRDLEPSSGLFWQAIHPDDRERISAVRASALTSGSFACDFRVLRPDGGERIVHQTGGLVCDERGRPTACTGTLQDISDRVQSERAALDTQQLLASFMGSLQTEAFIKDRDSHYLLINDFFAKTWGIDRRDAVGRGDESIFGAEIAARLRADDLRIMATETPEEFEYHGERGGVPYTWRTHKSPVFDSDGRVSGVCGVGFDVTAEHLVQDAILASEARLTAIVTAIPDAVTIVERDCTVVWANRVAADMVACDPVGRHWYELLCGGTRPCPACELAGVIDTGAPWQHEYETTVGGISSTFWASTVPWSRGDAEHPATALVMTRDISTRKGYEVGLLETSQELERQVAERVAEIERSRKAALNLMQDANLERERAERALAQHETLLREVHHRVKNNLNTVANILYFQSRAIDDEQARQAFSESQDRIKSMARIHEHLYRSWDISTVDMTAYLRDLTDDLRQVHGAGELTFVVEAAGVSLDIDHAVPCGLLVNELLTNACKHAFPAGGGHVIVRLTRKGDGLRLEVVDDGVGMPAGLDPASSGTLGLRLATMLARQLGSELQVESPPAGGAAFSVSFAENSSGGAT